jgi:hypothetical protein
MQVIGFGTQSLRVVMAHVSSRLQMATSTHLLIQEALGPSRQARVLGIGSQLHPIVMEADWLQVNLGATSSLL